MNALEAFLPQVRAVLGQNQILVLTAEPGAGKTTLLPPALLAEPWLGQQKILLLEPRRVAARAAATRMASLRQEKPGETIGWRMSQDTRIGSKTRLEVVTEGILTRMIQSDPSLDGVGLVLFDEFHERSLNADLGLALALDVRAQIRPDLRIGLLSATLDVDEVCTLLPEAVPVHASGRVFPVETEYRPPSEHEDALSAVVKAVRQGWSQVGGGLLVFLPGWSEIRRVAEELAAGANEKSEHILVLHGSLSAEDQAAVLAPLPQGQRKTVLASAVAETSLTIPDIELVIDLGLARLNRFDQGRGLDRLVTERVSQASADQRRGRAGRTKAGFCWRLWSSQEHLEKAAAPEIRRADLSSTALEAAAWGARSPDSMMWLTPPAAAAWEKARALLAELELLDALGAISSLGKNVVALGLGPRLGVVVHSSTERDLALTCFCVALLQDRDPLPTLQDPDFTLRLQPLIEGATGPAWSRIRQVAHDLARKRGVLNPSQPSIPEAHFVGNLLAPGYRDRVAMRKERSTTGATYQMQSGRALKLRGGLAESEWVLVLDADAGVSTGWITLAAPLSASAAEKALAPLTKGAVEVTWDGWQPRVFRVRTAGALELERTGLAVKTSSAEIRAALRTKLSTLEPEELPWNRTSEQLMFRLSALNHASASDWAWLEDFADLSGGPALTEHLLNQVLNQNLPWELRERLEHEAPETMVVPSGSRRKLEYRSDGSVVLEVRIQEVFGMVASPQVAGQPVVLALLSPANRPLQVTRDLASFWKNTYPEVRKEMRGRYPRHYWPENPLEAEPTARAKPRGT